MRFLITLALLGSGCMFITQFDPETQPCELNAPVGQQCLEHYECQATSQPDAGLCKRIPDAGL